LVLVQPTIQIDRHLFDEHDEIHVHHGSDRSKTITHFDVAGDLEPLLVLLAAVWCDV
jgi:hypothetical protein